MHRKNTEGTPTYSVVQVNSDEHGKPVFVLVGGLWRSTNPNSKTDFILRLGKMRLLVFKIDEKSKAKLASGENEDELLSKAV